MSARRSRKTITLDLRAILEKPVGTLGASKQQITPYEAGMRTAFVRAAQGSMRDAKRVVNECLRYGAFLLPTSHDDHRYVLHIPKDWNSDDWHEMYDRFGAPPWPGERDGLIPLERWKAIYGERPRPRRRSRLQTTAKT
jgi:hypothetical protein